MNKSYYSFFAKKATVHQARIQEIAVYSLNGDAWEKPPYAQVIYIKCFRRQLYQIDWKTAYSKDLYSIFKKKKKFNQISLFVLQLNKAEGNFVKFKSTFFGTFASNGLFLPPSTIDFDALFANFLDRLFTTPHVLVTFVVLFVLLIVLTVVLRRKDKRDFFMVGTNL